ncbi:MAG: hypothetical protein LBM75_11440 [Myxococcales bacterium]|jgi:hypothetical protein|nr:hypothetical protein [Myxococcales bacterium]
MALLTASACAQERLYFQPAQAVVSERHTGRLPVLSLPLVDDAGAVTGTLCLGAQGIYELALAPGETPRRVLHVELLLINEGTAPLRMEGQTQLVEMLSERGRHARSPTQMRVDGELADALVVAPDSMGDADLLFVLEESRVQGFELAWRVESSLTAFEGLHAFALLAPTESAYPRETYTGIWKGYFFPGCAEIPDWGRELFFAPLEAPEAARATLGKPRQ